MTTKERLFVKHYVNCRNATDAAVLSGYSKKSARQIGSENLSKPYILEAINLEIETIENRVSISTEMIVRELKKIAFANMGNLFEINNHNQFSLKPRNSIHEDALAGIKELIHTKNENAELLKIRLLDKIKALELLGKYLGMFNERPIPPCQTCSTQHLQSLSEEEIESRSDRILARLAASRGKKLIDVK